MRKAISEIGALMALAGVMGLDSQGAAGEAMAVLGIIGFLTIGYGEILRRREATERRIKRIRKMAKSNAR
jgi:hypothetical protein